MTRAERRREAREEARLNGYVESGYFPMPTYTVHGVCVRCGRYRACTMPAKVCNRYCLRELFGFVWAAKQFGVTL